MEKLITYFGQKAKVACDEKCNKAWGSTRPKEQLFDDEDDYVLLSDEELGDAPENPGTYENDIPKPINKQNIPNTWCVRECERCAMSEHGKYNEPLLLKDFSKRRYNIPSKHQEKINNKN